MKKTMLVLLMFILAGCAKSYTFNSNLDPKAVKDYFKASDVTLYQEGQTPPAAYEQKGLVEGESCQQRPDDVPASISDARTMARRAAADKKANGLIIKKCVLFKQTTKACITHALCIGQAIVTTPNSDK